MKTYVWGSGRFGRHLIEACRLFFEESEYELTGVIDTFAHGQRIDRYEVMPPDALHEATDAAVVIAIKSEKAVGEIIKTLQNDFSDNVKEILLIDQFFERSRNILESRMEPWGKYRKKLW